MKCSKCQTDNPETLKFCGECGTQLIPPPEAHASFTKTLESPVEIPPGALFAGKYEILEKLGRGGMGEVYRALDKNLGRQVAIKVLPEEFSEDQERMARFEREAKLLAVLNHPNIASIYGLEESDGRRFLVLELVEGETLSTRLDRGALPVDDALVTCRQIAEGLEVAHEKGIIHRDLKPGNIMITSEGQVKILDFGLAKAYAAETTDIDIEKSPTITAQMTAPGVIMGTAAYMSPGQARSRSVDKKTDIWAFGCVLYECLTGDRAFKGETVSDILAHILKGEPDWTKLPSNLPYNIRSLLRRCLQKDSRQRLQHIGDARIEIDEVDAPSVEESVAARPFPLGLSLALGAVLFVAGILIRPLIWNSRESMTSSGLVASVIKIEPGFSRDGIRRQIEFNWPSRTAMAISNDGRFVVYSAVNDAAANAEPCLFIRRIDELEAHPIEGTEAGISPFFSPDDKWIGFWADERLKKIAVDGGIAQDICEATTLFGASWSGDDRIAFTDLTTDFGLSVVSANGGNPEILTAPDPTREERDHRLPFWLPDARGILFTIMRDEVDLNPRIALFNTKTLEWKDLREDASHPQYLPTGHIIFLRQAVLMAVPFSLNDYEITGQAVRVRSNIMQTLNSTSPNYCSAAGQLGISKSGSLIYVEGSIIPDWKNSLAWVDKKGNDVPASSWRGPNYLPRLSQDGQRILFATLGTQQQIWICDRLRDASYPFISEDMNWTPCWSQDGKRIVFGSKRSGLPYSFCSKSLDGSSPTEELLFSIPPGRLYYLNSLSPDGRLALVDRMGNQSDILIYDILNKNIAPFRTTEHNELSASFSPDGRWLAYCSDIEGRSEVYVSSSSGQGGDEKVSLMGGIEPGWARGGQQLFYRSQDGAEMWVVDVKTGSNFSAGKARLLFERKDQDLGTSGTSRCWDISLDDQRFLMVKREERQISPITEMILIQNWFEEVKRLAPTGR